MLRRRVADAEQDHRWVSGQQKIELPRWCTSARVITLYPSSTGWCSASTGVRRTRSARRRLDQAVFAQQRERGHQPG